MRLMVDQWNDICWLAAYAPSQFSAVVPAHWLLLVWHLHRTKCKRKFAPHSTAREPPPKLYVHRKRNLNQFVAGLYNLNTWPLTWLFDLQIATCNFFIPSVWWEPPLGVFQSDNCQTALHGNENLAVANRSRISCAHNMSRASMITPVTLKSRLTVTQGHWKRNHWEDHTWLTIRRVIARWMLSWPWNVGQRSKITQGHWD